MRKKLKIGLFGFGCVGQGLYEVLNQSQLLDANIEKIVVKTKGKSVQSQKKTSTMLPMIY